MAKKKKITFDMKQRFNDIVMRELGLDYTEDDNNYLYDIDTTTIMRIKQKFIKYFEDDYIVLKHDEIELNVLENPRLFEIISLPFINNYCSRNNLIFHSMEQSITDNSNGKGEFHILYIRNDGKNIIEKISSDPYINESVRIFNLICKLNKTTNLYKFDKFDIKIERKK